MHIKRLNIFFIVAFFFTVIAGFGQKSNFSSAGFRPPLDIPLYLSGTFGELRSNHFHAGIDIKTQGAEGEKVFAIADGYVSRIKVSTSGYGKVLYITHPNGFVSVYGHLKQFNGKLNIFVRDLQYRKESYTVESFPEKGKLKVKKGEIIALSGNTGGSEGPHLHFEIREESTQFPLNPLFFENISVEDQFSPGISLLAVYPVHGQTLINGQNDTAFFTVERIGKEFILSPHREIVVSGPFSLGLLTYDQMNGARNKNGIYSVELLLDNEKVFGLEMDKLSFATTRYLNSLIDYPYFKLRKRRLIRTQVDTNNRLFNYRDVSNNGIFSFSDSLSHSFKYIVSDIYRNTSELSFSVLASNALPENNKVKLLENKGLFFDYSKENTIDEAGISLRFPANAFYRSFYFQLKTSPAEANSYAPLYAIHNKFTPVQKHFTMTIKPDSIPEGMQKKMYIAYRTNQNEHFFIGAKWKGNKLTAKSRLLGDYTIMADTVKPEIKPYNFFDGKNVSKQNNLRVKIRDGETGIKSYRGTLNGDWVLMEYYPKKNRLIYNFDGHLQKGENHFKLVVKDLLDNENIYEATVVY